MVALKNVRRLTETPCFTRQRKQNSDRVGARTQHKFHRSCWSSAKLRFEPAGERESPQTPDSTSRTCQGSHRQWVAHVGGKPTRSGYHFGITSHAVTATKVTRRDLRRSSRAGCTGVRDAPIQNCCTFVVLGIEVGGRWTMKHPTSPACSPTPGAVPALPHSKQPPVLLWCPGGQLSLPTPQRCPSQPTCCLKTFLPTTTCTEISQPSAISLPTLAAPCVPASPVAEALVYTFPPLSLSGHGFVGYIRYAFCCS